VHFAVAFMTYYHMETHVQFTGSVCSPQYLAEIMASPDIGKCYVFVTFSAIGRHFEGYNSNFEGLYRYFTRYTTNDVYKPARICIVVFWFLTPCSLIQSEPTQAVSRLRDMQLSKLGLQ